MAGSYYFYYLHNLDFIVYARSMQGRIGETNQAIAQIEEAVRTGPEPDETFRVLTVMCRMRVEQWDALLAAPQPSSKNPLVLPFWRYARATALAAKGKPQEAAVEQAEFEALRGKLDRNVDFGNNKVGAVMDLASMILSARLESNASSSVRTWRKAVEMQDALLYDEPPSDSRTG